MPLRKATQWAFAAASEWYVVLELLAGTRLGELER
jgi:hypothetical protein